LLGEVRAITTELEVEGMSATPPQRKRINNLVERTPGKLPTPARAAPVLPQPPEQSLPSPMPPSTAPARQHKGKGGRERRRTIKEAESKARSLLTES
jgi:hypothetical protein